MPRSLPVALEARRHWTKRSCTACDTSWISTMLRCYSEHLSYCTDDGHLYDLMPIPFTAEAVEPCCRQDSQGTGHTGAENRHRKRFLLCSAGGGTERNRVYFGRSAKKPIATCSLDVNNIYVNSVNHRYDAIRVPAGPSRVSGLPTGISRGITMRLRT